MFPFVRLLREFVINRNAPPLETLETHVSYHRCWPHDLDIFMEMNNGRILTILDLGRTSLAKRVGLLQALQDNGWGMTMAGVSVRYRRRLRMFETFRVHSRAVGWDDKFFYIDQSIWKGDTCATQALYRSAITDANGIVSPERVFAHVGYDKPSPPLPTWVQNWIAAENTRVWPPLIEEMS